MSTDDFDLEDFNLFEDLDEDDDFEDLDDEVLVVDDDVPIVHEHTAANFREVLASLQVVKENGERDFSAELKALHDRIPELERERKISQVREANRKALAMKRPDTFGGVM